MGISWGGFGDKTEVNLPQRIPDIAFDEIHPNFPELARLCETTNINKSSNKDESIEKKKTSRNSKVSK
jgi:hypothetical protein